ncbi:MAG: hypothetical protein U0840_27510 [Gemmataceae bacterium]
MSEQSRSPQGQNRILFLSIGGVVIVVVCVAVWLGWTIHQREQARKEALRGLEGIWVDETNPEASYQFRIDGEFLIRQKLPANLAPFSGDPGIEFRPWGKWWRNGQIITVQSVRNWGYDLVLGEDGLLRGERVVDQWSGQGEHSRTRVPVVLKKKEGAR